MLVNYITSLFFLCSSVLCLGDISGFKRLMQTFNFLKTGGQEEKSKDNRGGNDCKLSIISSEM